MKPQLPSERKLNGRTPPPTPSLNAGMSELVDLAREIGEPDNYSGKRQCLRIKVGERLDVCTDPQNPASAMMATLHNVSEDGCAFWLKTQQERWGILYVRQFNPDGEAVWTHAEVRHCTRGIQGFLVGVVFTS